MWSMVVLRRFLAAEGRTDRGRESDPEFSAAGVFIQRVRAITIAISIPIASVISLWTTVFFTPLSLLMLCHFRKIGF
jgi:hypothetical protein